MTTVHLSGNTTADPELRFTPSGAAVAEFTVAVNERVKDGDSWRDGDPSFYRVTCWRQLAEHVAERVTKGQRVVVTGKLKVRTFDTRTGSKAVSVEVEADDVGLSLMFAGERRQESRPPVAADPWAQQTSEMPPF